MSSKTHHFDLSYPTVIAGAVAAATATALSSRLGLVGTILGAVVASVISTIVSTSVVAWIERAHGAAKQPRAIPYLRFLVGVGGIALVVLAFHTGLGLLLDGLPGNSFAGRMVAQMGLHPGS
jgi:uncharacterized iron-regulated membrane protein